MSDKNADAADCPRAAGNILPRIIQGGMGAGVSNWLLANSVSRAGGLGVVSGTALDAILTRRLQDGDPGGHMRRALERFPVLDMARRIVQKYFQPDGRQPGKPYKRSPVHSAEPSAELVELTVCANFAEIYLAREGHNGPVGINYLEKIALPTLASLLGAMLAGVDCVLMGAGIPVQIPGIMDHFARGEAAELRIKLEDAPPGDDARMLAQTVELLGEYGHTLKRPFFLPIISSHTLGRMLAAKSSGAVNGFIVEGPTAGGHNAPPRGVMELNERGEPIYGERDEPDLNNLAELGLPFWLAGSRAQPGDLKRALELGAAGVQVGSIFALCDESGLAGNLKEQIIEGGLQGKLETFTDPLASPSGFPFKVALLEETLTDGDVYHARSRVCDLGFLRQLYRRPDGGVGYRCASEPLAAFIKKGGEEEQTEGRKCLCNSLLANIGLPQVQKNGYLERPLVTLGDDLGFLKHILKDGRKTYAARDVMDYLNAG